MKKIKNNSMKWQLKTSHNLCLNTILAGKQKSNPQRSLIKVYRYLNTICHTHDQFKTYTNNMSLRHDNNCVLYAHLKIYKMFDVWALWVMNVHFCNDIHVCHGMSSGNKNENSNGLRLLLIWTTIKCLILKKLYPTTLHHECICQIS